MAKRLKQWRDINKQLEKFLETSSDDEESVLFSPGDDANVYDQESDLPSPHEDTDVDVFHDTNSSHNSLIMDDVSEEEQYNDTSESSDSDDDISNNTNTLAEDLAGCAIRNNWTQTSVTELLHILRDNGHISLPSDCHTLLKTPRNIPVQMKCGGKYVYLGIQSGLNQKMSGLNLQGEDIELIVNIDGLPLHRSTALSAWPILCSVQETILIVALFCGDKKAGPIGEFLADFLVELKELQTNGYEYNLHKYKISVKAFLCDAPARALLKGIVYHTGHYACERCEIKGTFEGRVVYNDRKIYPLRSDNNFNQMLYAVHQRSVTPLVEAGISCIHGFVLDYMHCVMLGVVRRMLHFFKKGPKGKLSSQQMQMLSEKLVSLNGQLPSEFARQPRSLELLERWKATEFRQFLLYTGPIVLRNILSSEAYEHFLSLSLAISILLDSNDQFRAEIYIMLSSCYSTLFGNQKKCMVKLFQCIMSIVYLIYLKMSSIINAR